MADKKKDENMSEELTLDLPEGQKFTGVGVEPEAKQTVDQPQNTEAEKDGAQIPPQETQKPNDAPAQTDPENEPIKDWEKANLGLENLEINKDVFAEFGKQAVALGLSPRQAKGLAEWQLTQIAQARAKMVDEGIKELAKEWGTSAGDNQGRIVSLIERVDRALGNDSFSKMLFGSDAACSTDFMRGMLALANMVKEDAVGGEGTTIGKKEETALEGLQEVFRMARGNK